MSSISTHVSIPHPLPKCNPIYATDPEFFYENTTDFHKKYTHSQNHVYVQHSSVNIILLNTLIILYVLSLSIDSIQYIYTQWYYVLYFVCAHYYYYYYYCCNKNKIIYNICVLYNNIHNILYAVSIRGGRFADDQTVETSIMCLDAAATDVNESTKSIFFLPTINCTLRAFVQ